MNIKEMKARLAAISAEAKTASNERLTELLAEAQDLEAKIAAAETREKLGKIAGTLEEGAPNTHGEAGQGAEDVHAKNGKTLLAGGKISRKFAVKNELTSSSVLLEKHTAPTLNPAWNESSSLMDRVRIITLPGGESYERGFVKSYGEGDYTAEGEKAKTAEPTFGYAPMTKSKITAYCEEPEEIGKLAPADYSRTISNSTEIALRKKINREIMNGNGTAGHLCGIFHNPADESKDIIDRNTDLSVSAIDENTLDDIIYSYGSNEEVEDAATLILNKLDLKAFAKCRKTNGDKAYTVVNRGNVGTIDGIPYIINSACAAISDKETAADAYCMAYGHLSLYELPVFSDMVIKKSTEYKFAEGQIAHRGDVFCGGNAAAYNAFIRVKKSAT